MHEWKTWEVFARLRNGVAHRHVGSVNASDADMAMEYARDTFTRRGEFVSLWLVASEHLVSSGDLDRTVWFDGAAGKDFRHATFYDVPDGVQHL